MRLTDLYVDRYLARRGVGAGGSGERIRMRVLICARASSLISNRIQIMEFLASVTIHILFDAPLRKFSTETNQKRGGG